MRFGFYFVYKELNVSDPCGSFRTSLTIIMGKRNYKILNLHHDMV